MVRRQRLTRPLVVLGAAGVAFFALAVCLSPARGLAQGAQTGAPQPGYFNRVATFDVPGTVAEIVAATPDGQTLVYTNAADKQLGFVNLADPAKPALLGTLSVPGALLELPAP